MWKHVPANYVQKKGETAEQISKAEDATGAVGADDKMAAPGSSGHSEKATQVTRFAFLPVMTCGGPTVRDAPWQMVSQYVALHDYNAADDEDMSFKEGDVSIN